MDIYGALERHIASVNIETLEIIAGFFWPLWICVIAYAFITAKKYPVAACIPLTAGAILLPYVLLTR